MFRLSTPARWWKPPARAMPSSAASPRRSPRGIDPIDAARFGSAAAGISVTRAGTAPAMPQRAEIEALLKERSAP